MRNPILAFLLSLLALPAFAQHGATVAATPNAGESYNVYAGKTTGGPYTKLNPTPLTAPMYTDTSQVAGATVYYVMSGLLNGKESPFSLELLVRIPQNPTGATCPPLAAGCRIKITSTAPLRGTPSSNTVLPPQIGTVTAGQLGTVLGISTFGYAPFGVTNWVQVQFDTCAVGIPNCTGWAGNDNMTIVTTTPPPQPLAINCAVAVAGVTNLPAGPYKMDVVSGTTTATCTGTK